MIVSVVGSEQPCDRSGRARRCGKSRAKQRIGRRQRQVGEDEAHAGPAIVAPPPHALGRRRVLKVRTWAQERERDLPTLGGGINVSTGAWGVTRSCAGDGSLAVWWCAWGGGRVGVGDGGCGMILV